MHRAPRILLNNVANLLNVLWSARGGRTTSPRTILVPASLLITIHDIVIRYLLEPGHNANSTKSKQTNNTVTAPTFHKKFNVTKNKKQLNEKNKVTLKGNFIVTLYGTQ